MDQLSIAFYAIGWMQAIITTAGLFIAMPVAAYWVIVTVERRQLASSA